MDVGLVGLVLLGGEAAEAREHLRRDPDGKLRLFCAIGAVLGLALRTVFS